MKISSNFTLISLLFFLVSCAGGHTKISQNNIEIEIGKRTQTSSQNQETPNIIKNKEIELNLPTDSKQNFQTDNSKSTTKEVKTFYGPMLNIYNGTPGSFDGRSIHQKNLKLEESENGYTVKIEASDLFKEIYNGAKNLPEETPENYLEAINEVLDFSEKYNFQFIDKESILEYLDTFKENIPDEYELVSKNGNEYKYKSKNTPYEVYWISPETTVKAYSDFYILQDAYFEELKEIICLSGCDSTDPDPLLFEIDGNKLTLEQLRKYDNGKYSDLKYRNGAFFYYKETEIPRFKNIDLLGLENPTEEKNVDKIKEKYLKIKFMGEETDLSYADFGYWQESEVLENNETKIGYAIPLIGGIENKRIEEKDLANNLVFEGNVVANVKKVNENSVALDGKIKYIFDREASSEKSFEVSIPSWYNIEVKSTGQKLSSGEEKSNWIFTGDIKNNNPEIKNDGLGSIKEVRYYCEGNRLESVGILEYKDNAQTHLTLTYGAIKK